MNDIFIDYFRFSFFYNCINAKLELNTLYIHNFSIIDFSYTYFKKNILHPIIKKTNQNAIHNPLL